MGGGMAVVVSGTTNEAIDGEPSLTGSDHMVYYKSSELNRVIPQLMIGGSIQHNRVTLEAGFFQHFREYLNDGGHPRNNGFNLSVSYRIK